MLKQLIRKRLEAFGRQYDYDTGYVRDVLDADLKAFLAFSAVQAMSSYLRDVPVEVAYAVKIVGTMSEDCGPCTQLMVTFAQRDGVDPGVVAAIVRGDEAALSAEVRLGIAFARASLAHAPEADEHREQILAKWGPRALVTLAFGLVLSRVYPTLKYALGHGKTCQRVVVAGQAIAPHAATA
jgi:hypothetical protein